MTISLTTAGIRRLGNISSTSVTKGKLISESVDDQVIRSTNKQLFTNAEKSIVHAGTNIAENTSIKASKQGVS